MKKLILIFFISLLVIIPLNGQYYKKKREVVKILSEVSYLNSGMRSSYGGKSRIIIKVDLPKNTVEWFYSLTTSRNKNTQETLNLAAQLSNLLDPTGYSSILVSSINVLSGSSPCDVYLMDYQNAIAFRNKVDNKGGMFYYYPSDSRENFISGTVNVKDITKGSWYLGLKNPSSMYALTINIEAAAIVETW